MRVWSTAPLRTAVLAPAIPTPFCRGFDVYVNMVLEDVIEYEITPEGQKVSCRACCAARGWAPEPGRGARQPACNASCHTMHPPRHTIPAQETRLDKILLNGNNIALLVPGGKPEGVN